MIIWATFVTYSHDDGDLSQDTLASVPLGVDLSGGYLHDEGPIHRQLTLPVNDGLEGGETEWVRLDKTNRPRTLE